MILRKAAVSHCCMSNFLSQIFKHIIFRFFNRNYINRPAIICRRPDSHTCFYLLVSFVYLEMSLIPSIFCTIAAFSLRVRRTFFSSE